MARTRNQIKKQAEYHGMISHNIKVNVSKNILSISNRNHSEEFTPVNGKFTVNLQVHDNVHIVGNQRNLRSKDKITKGKSTNAVEKTNVLKKKSNEAINERNLRSKEKTSQEKSAKNAVRKTNVLKQKPNEVVEQRNLRSKKKITKEKSLEATETRITKNNVVNKSLNELIRDTWTSSKKDKNHTNFNINDIVMAKMRTYSAWPSKIIKFNDKHTKCEVEFFGCLSTGWIDIKEIVPFSESAAIIKLLIVRQNHQFNEGIRIVEQLFEVPSHLSIFNN